MGEMRQMFGKTGLFRGYNQKMALFFDCKYVIWKSRNVHSGRHEMQLAKGIVMQEND